MGKRAQLISFQYDNRGYHDKNRISELPDEILATIVSLLTAREAVRTSVLSHRWVRVWKFVSTLKFEAAIQLKVNVKPVKLERPSFVRWVSQVLQSHQAPTLEEFKVLFHLDEDYSNNFDHWIRLAIQKGVQKLHLDFSTSKSYQSKLYRFPELHSPSLGYPTCDSLRSLHLSSIDVSDEVIEYFLSKCLLLEHLCVKGSNRLIRLIVDGESLKLTHLEIFQCFQLKSLEIWAENLVSFEYYGPRLDNPFKNVPKLVKASIGGDFCHFLVYRSSMISMSMPRLETLTLKFADLRLWGIYARCLRVPELSNLKELQVNALSSEDESFLALTSLIDACPFLHQFTFKRRKWNKGPLAICEPEVTNRSHQCLKVVEIGGFVGHKNDIELLTYFTKNAVSLEKIIINPRASGAGKDAAIARARRMELPAGIELVLL